MKHFDPPDEALRALLRAASEAPLSASEFRVRVDAPFTDWELENDLALIRWFNRRYPTPEARLVYSIRDWTPK